MITTYTFSIKNITTDPHIPTITIANSTIANSSTTPIDLPKISDTISKEELQKRLIFDVMKDGNASDIHIDNPDVYDNFKHQAFDQECKIDTQANYMTSLKEIEKKMEHVIGKGIDFPGLIKKSSDQTSGTKIMKTKEIFFESGANEQSVCNIDPGIYKAERICTPAAALDSASKGTCARYFPPQLPPTPPPPPLQQSGLPPLPLPGPSQPGPSQPGPSQPGPSQPGPSQAEPGSSQLPATQIREVVFDKLFCNRFGFPNGFTWSAKNIDDKEDEFIVTFTCSAIDIDISGNVIWDGNFKGSPFFVLGNKEKNKKINTLMKTPITDEKKKQIFLLLLMKELGDVMQVFMYYAYVMIKRYETRSLDIISVDEISKLLCSSVPIEDNAMLTVDSVVYLLCRVLSLPCVYTGARAGVLSGQAFYKLYTPKAMTNEAVYSHITQSLENMYTNIHNSNNTNIKHLTSIKNGLSEPGRDDTGTLKWYFFFIKSDSALTDGKPRWIEETMSAFARYTNANAGYNVPDKIISTIIANVETLITEIGTNNTKLTEEKNKLIQEYITKNASLQTRGAILSVNADWYNWDTSTDANKIIKQREFINEKLAVIGKLNQYRSVEHVTELKKKSYIVNCAKQILCDGLSDYRVRPKQILINAESIIDIKTEVDNKLEQVVKAIRGKFGVQASGLNRNAGMADTDQEMVDDDEKEEDEVMADTPSTYVVPPPPTPVADPPVDDSSKVQKMGLFASPGSSSGRSGSISRGSPINNGPSSAPSNVSTPLITTRAASLGATPLTTRCASSSGIFGSEVNPDGTPPASQPETDGTQLASQPETEGREPGAASQEAADMDTDLVNNPEEFLDLYNIDKNIDFLSKFLCDMINIHDVIEFTSTPYEIIDPAVIPVFSDIQEAIRAILINKYYYSNGNIAYNELFEILTGLGKEKITEFSKDTNLTNACAEYKKATKAKFENIDEIFKKQKTIKDEERTILIDDEDILYININDDTYDWGTSSSSSPLTPSPLPSSARRKGKAVTRKNNNRHKKNKQSKRNGRVKNKRSRKIMQRNKIKNSRRKKHGNSKQSKRNKRGNYIKIK